MHPRHLLVVERGTLWSTRLARWLADGAATRGAGRDAWCIDTIEADGDVLALLRAAEPLPDLIGLCVSARLPLDLWRALAQTPAVPLVALLDAPGVPDLTLDGVVEAVFANAAPDEIRWRLARCVHQHAAAPTRGNAASAPLHARLQELAQASPSLTPLLDRLPRIASCDAPLLITGETGTGKELLARAVHYLSARATKAWVAVNCAALPAELVDSEFFGHVRGAFTGAHQSRPGLIAEAHEGTLFLDEIDSLALPAQGKLLRFLQEGEYRPVGADRVLAADVRVIAAGNADFEPLVESGRFRRDLYYRLKVLTLKLSPLRERRGDITHLARHFVHRFAAEYHLPLPALTPAALGTLASHNWPGNVRELEHTIERGCLMCRNQCIDSNDLDLPDGRGCFDDSAAGFKQAKQRVIDDFERAYIERLLLQHEGNISRAAAGAHKNRRAFWELVRKHDIDPDRFRPAH